MGTIFIITAIILIILGLSGRMIFVQKWNSINSPSEIPKEKRKWIMIVFFIGLIMLAYSFAITIMLYNWIVLGYCNFE
jgi:hypothetical protein